MASALSRFLKPSTRGAVDAGLLALRLGFGLTLALKHGLAKLLDLEKFIGTVAKHGFPLPGVFGPIAMLSEFAGGLLLAVGLMTRPAATFVLATMLGAALKVHAHDPFSKKELALAYALVALVLFVTGPGRYSLDARFERGRRSR
jgi:putative oxidoreductase